MSMQRSKSVSIVVASAIATSSIFSTTAYADMESAIEKYNQEIYRVYPNATDEQAEEAYDVQFNKAVAGFLTTGGTYALSKLNTRNARLRAELLAKMKADDVGNLSPKITATQSQLADVEAKILAFENQDATRATLQAAAKEKLEAALHANGETRKIVEGQIVALGRTKTTILRQAMPKTPKAVDIPLDINNPGPVQPAPQPVLHPATQSFVADLDAQIGRKSAQLEELKIKASGLNTDLDALKKTGKIPGSSIVTAPEYAHLKTEALPKLTSELRGLEETRKSTMAAIAKIEGKNAFRASKLGKGVRGGLKFVGYVGGAALILDGATGMYLADAFGREPGIFPIGTLIKRSDSDEFVKAAKLIFQD